MLKFANQRLSNTDNEEARHEGLSGRSRWERTRNASACVLGLANESNKTDARDPIHHRSMSFVNNLRSWKKHYPQCFTVMALPPAALSVSISTTSAHSR